MKKIILFLSSAFIMSCSGQVNHSDYVNDFSDLIGCSLTKPPADNFNKPNALIIGDSISIGYTPHLRNLLTSHNVIHNHCNAQRTSSGLKYIDLWLSQRNSWDIITFNHGVWDIVENEISADQYAINLKTIAKKIKQKSSNVYFITTTYLPNTDLERFESFRSAALQVMVEENINVIDLDVYSRTILNHQNNDAVHFYGHGDFLFGNFIYQEILSF